MRSRFTRLIMVLGLLAGVLLFPVPPANAGCFGTVRQTATYSGTGSSCAAAYSNWESQAMSEAEQVCPVGVCFTPVTTTSCFWDSSCGAYRASGYFTYKCGV